MNLKLLISNLLALIIFTASFSTMAQRNVKLPKQISKAYEYIPSGNTRVDSIELSVQGFYMFKHEISNLDYKEFLYYLKRNNELEKLKIAQVDSQNWNLALQYGEPMIENYHQHPAYNEYPVVNISMEAAQLYCDWLSQILNKTYPDFKFSVRLPLRAEWILATTSYDFSPYVWGGPYLQNAKGEYLCNFKRIGEENIHTSDDHKLIQIRESWDTQSYNTQPVKSYPPNEYGLYNMNGNVAEMTHEGLACGGSWNSTGYDVRNLSYIIMDGPAPTIGFRPILLVSKAENN